MTQMYLAYTGATAQKITMEKFDFEKYPISVLVSFHYLKGHQGTKPYHPPTMMLDSGAFSAWNAGAEIDIQALIKETKKPEWDESVALDVIRDPEGSLKNALLMKAQGSPAFPVFHYGDPWEIMDEYVKHFPKMGLSCRFGEPVKKSLKWLEACYARHWPMKYHSFGWVMKKMLQTFPFHTADTASWGRMPCEWGHWKAFGGQRVSCRPKGGKIDITAEALFYYDIQKELKWQWRKEMKILDGL